MDRRGDIRISISGESTGVPGGDLNFEDGPIRGVSIRELRRYEDDRGWLIETFRSDELEKASYPAMGYTSLTVPGTARGPHEHESQTDLFVFLGPGRFRMWLWDNRPDSPTYRNRQVFEAGEGAVLQVLVPPGVVHAYKNVGEKPAVVQNFPNRLYAGVGKRSEVDEIRHEDDPETPYQLR